MRAEERPRHVCKVGTSRTISYGTSILTITGQQTVPVGGTRVAENVLVAGFHNMQKEVITVIGDQVTEVYVVVYLNNKDSAKDIKKGIIQQKIKCSITQMLK